MSIIEAITEIPAEHEKNVFGQFDQHIKKIERTLNVTMILRDGTLKIIGDAVNVSKAKEIVQDLVKLSMRGNTIEEQNINYALALTMENTDTGSMVEIDKDCICHTINGKVIKPKTLGQKAYVGHPEQDDRLRHRARRYRKNLSCDGDGDFGLQKRRGCQNYPHKTCH